MNSLKKTGAAFLLLFAITSCIPHEAPEPDLTPGNLISINGSMEEPGTRTTLSEGIHTHWVSGDYIGLFSDEVNSGYDNSPYRAQNSASTSEFTGEMEWGSASTSHTFYAYYPYDGDASTATAVPFYLVGRFLAPPGTKSGVKCAGGQVSGPYRRKNTNSSTKKPYTWMNDRKSKVPPQKRPQTWTDCQKSQVPPQKQPYM